MKSILVLLSVLVGSSLFGQTWYAYCVVNANAVHYCTYPEVKSDAIKTECMNLATKVGAETYSIQESTDLAQLETGMPAHCDELSGTDKGKIYSCNISSLCKVGGTPRVSHLHSRVHSLNKNGAIQHCANENKPKLKQKLKEQSSAGCYIKLLVQAVN